MTSSMRTSAPAARRAPMCAAKSSGVSLAVAKTSFAFGARSWTISSIAVPSSPLPFATIRTSAGRLPEATEAARLATPSERTPTVTPRPDSLAFDRTRSGPRLGAGSFGPGERPLEPAPQLTGALLLGQRCGRPRHARRGGRRGEGGDVSHPGQVAECGNGVDG